MSNTTTLSALNDLNSSRVSARGNESSRIAEPKSSARGDNTIAKINSARSDKSINSSRSNPATDRSMETYRTSMSTARVHTALAALTAEKNALLTKLQAIDAALESEDKKKASKPRATKK